MSDKQIYIVGIGTGASTITAEGLECIQQAEVLMGAKRMLDEFAHIDAEKHVAYMPDDIVRIVESSAAARFVVLMSGDVGFYSGAAALADRLDGYNMRFIPGISSVGALCARLKVPWQDAALLSMHGADGGVVSAVRRNRRSICLTGGNTAEIARQLCGAGLGGVKVYAGENLGCEDERIVECKADELAHAQLAPLTILLIENENHDSRVRTGIPDDEFARGEVPMTKSEVRAVTLARLGLHPGSICYDIGAGTGSVTIEMALSAYEGHVYAIDAKPQAIQLVNENCAKFHVGNVTAIEGKAPDAMEGLPAPDAAFIGGSSGNMADIIGILVRSNPSVRVVVNAIALESVGSALAAMEEAGLAGIEVTQISAARARAVAGLHMMTGLNPVTVISGGGHE